MRRFKLAAFKCTESCVCFLLSWTLLDKELATQKDEGVKEGVEGPSAGKKECYYLLLMAFYPVML